MNRGVVAEMFVNHLETMKILQSRAVGCAPKFSGAVGWTSQSGRPLAVRHYWARSLTSSVVGRGLQMYAKAGWDQRQCCVVGWGYCSGSLVGLQAVLCD